MKRIITGIATILFIMIAASSCKKAANVDGGTWSFKSQTYKVTSGIADVSQMPGVSYVDTISSLVTVCKTSNSYGDIVFTFYNYPTASGAYTITRNQYPDSGSHEIAVQMILQTGSGTSLVENTYNPTAYSASSASANVTVASNGWININIQSLMMLNADTSKTSDSSALVTNVKQTQNAL
jgi:hypothetical protein